MMRKPGAEKWMHIGFEMTLLVKGVDGLLEVIGGILFLLVDPARLNQVVVGLTMHERSEDPSDFIANLLIHMSQAFSTGTQTFVVLYLISHGLAKVLMVYLLFLKKLWAYPVGIGFLLMFIAYQMHRYMYSHSNIMILLTLFDLAMIGMTVVEYRKIKSA